MHPTSSTTQIAISDDSDGGWLPSTSQATERISPHTLDTCTKLPHDPIQNPKRVKAGRKKRTQKFKKVRFSQSLTYHYNPDFFRQKALLRANLDHSRQLNNTNREEKSNNTDYARNYYWFNSLEAQHSHQYNQHQWFTERQRDVNGVWCKVQTGRNGALILPIIEDHPEQIDKIEPNIPNQQSPPQNALESLLSPSSDITIPFSSQYNETNTSVCSPDETDVTISLLNNLSLETAKQAEFDSFHPLITNFSPSAPSFPPHIELLGRESHNSMDDNDHNPPIYPYNDINSIEPNSYRNNPADQTSLPIPNPHDPKHIDPPQTHSANSSEPLSKVLFGPPWALVLSKIELHLPMTGSKSFPMKKNVRFHLSPPDTRFNSLEIDTNYILLDKQELENASVSRRTRGGYQRSEQISEIENSTCVNNGFTDVNDDIIFAEGDTENDINHNNTQKWSKTRYFSQKDSNSNQTDYIPNSPSNIPRYKSSTSSSSHIEHNNIDSEILLSHLDQNSNPINPSAKLSSINSPRPPPDPSLKISNLSVHTQPFRPISSRSKHPKEPPIDTNDSNPNPPPTHNPLSPPVPHSTQFVTKSSRSKRRGGEQNVRMVNMGDVGATLAPIKENQQPQEVKSKPRRSYRRKNDENQNRLSKNENHEISFENNHFIRLTRSRKRRTKQSQSAPQPSDGLFTALTDQSVSTSFISPGINDNDSSLPQSPPPSVINQSHHIPTLSAAPRQTQPISSSHTQIHLTNSNCEFERIGAGTRNNAEKILTQNKTAPSSPLTSTHPRRSARVNPLTPSLDGTGTHTTPLPNTLTQLGQKAPYDLIFDDTSSNEDKNVGTIPLVVNNKNVDCIVTISENEINPNKKKNGFAHFFSDILASSDAMTNSSTNTPTKSALKPNKSTRGIQSLDSTPESSEKQPTTSPPQTSNSNYLRDPKSFPRRLSVRRQSSRKIDISEMSSEGEDRSQEDQTPRNPVQSTPIMSIAKSTDNSCDLKSNPMLLDQNVALSLSTPILTHNVSINIRSEPQQTCNQEHTTPSTCQKRKRVAFTTQEIIDNDKFDCEMNEKNPNNSDSSPPFTPFQLFSSKHSNNTENNCSKSFQHGDTFGDDHIINELSPTTPRLFSQSINNSSLTDTPPLHQASLHSHVTFLPDPVFIPNNDHHDEQSHQQTLYQPTHRKKQTPFQYHAVTNDIQHEYNLNTPNINHKTVNTLSNTSFDDIFTTPKEEPLFIDRDISQPIKRPFEQDNGEYINRPVMLGQLYSMNSPPNESFKEAQGVDITTPLVETTVNTARIPNLTNKDNDCDAMIGDGDAKNKSKTNSIQNIPNVFYSHKTETKPPQFGQDINRIEQSINITQTTPKTRDNSSLDDFVVNKTATKSNRFDKKPNLPSKLAKSRKSLVTSRVDSTITMFDETPVGTDDDGDDGDDNNDNNSHKQTPLKPLQPILLVSPSPANESPQTPIPATPLSATASFRNMVKELEMNSNQSSSEQSGTRVNTDDSEDSDDFISNRFKHIKATPFLSRAMPPTGPNLTGSLGLRLSTFGANSQSSPRVYDLTTENSNSGTSANINNHNHDLRSTSNISNRTNSFKRAKNIPNNYINNHQIENNNFCIGKDNNTSPSSSSCGNFDNNTPPTFKRGQSLANTDFAGDNSNIGNDNTDNTDISSQTSSQSSSQHQLCDYTDEENIPTINTLPRQTFSALPYARNDRLKTTRDPAPAGVPRKPLGTLRNMRAKSGSSKSILGKPRQGNITSRLEQSQQKNGQYRRE